MAARSARHGSILEMRQSDWQVLAALFGFADWQDMRDFAMQHDEAYIAADAKSNGKRNNSKCYPRKPKVEKGYCEPF